MAGQLNRACLHITLLLAGIVRPDLLFAQTAMLQGRIVFQNSGNLPAAGVLVKSDDANATRSTASGAFTLHYATKVAGDRIRLTVGDTAKVGRAVEVVNREVLDGARLGKDLQDTLIIVVCDKGSVREAKRRYYNILELQNTQNHRNAVAANEAALQRNDLDRATIRTLKHQRDSLEERYRIVAEQLDTTAAYLARINLDQASDLVRRAVQSVDETGDMKGILEILSTSALAAALKEAEHMQRTTMDRFEQLATAHVVRVQALYARGDFDSTVHCMHSLLKLREQYLATDTAEMIRALIFLSIAEYTTSDLEGALAHRRQAVDLAERMPTLDPRVVENLYVRVGEMEMMLGKYEEALHSLDMRRIVLERMEPPDSLLLAWAECGRGTCLGYLGRSEEMLAGHKRIVEQWSLRIPEDAGLLAGLLSNMGAAYFTKGDLDSAYRYLQASALLWENVPLPPDPELAMLYSNLASCSYEQDKLMLAEGYSDQALRIKTKFLAPGHVAFAESHSARAAILMEMGHVEEALVENSKVIEILEPVVDEHHVELVQAYNNQGALLHRLSRENEARNYVQLALRQDARSQLHHTASSLSLLSEIENNAGDHHKAIAYLDTLLGLWGGQVSHSNRRIIAEAYANRAYVFHCAKEPERAERAHIEACVQYAQATLEFPEDRDLHLKLGRELEWLDDDSTALHHFKRALDIAFSETALDHDVVGAIRGKIAASLCAEDSCDQALVHATERLISERQVHADAHAHLLSALKGLADVLWDQNRTDTALTVMREALAIQRSLGVRSDAAKDFLVLAARRFARSDTAFAEQCLMDATAIRPLGACDILDSLGFDSERVRALSAMGHYREALALASASAVLERTEQHYGKRSGPAGYIHERLARIYKSLGETNEERKHLRAAERLRAYGEKHLVKLRAEIAQYAPAL